LLAGPAYRVDSNPETVRIDLLVYEQQTLVPHLHSITSCQATPPWSTGFVGTKWIAPTTNTNGRWPLPQMKFYVACGRDGLL